MPSLPVASANNDRCVDAHQNKEQASTTTTANCTDTSTPKFLWILGSCALDRLLAVAHYPEPETKMRTTAYHEVGGGNASNVAHAAALLLSPRPASSTTTTTTTSAAASRVVRLCTKIGADAMGQTVLKELQAARVDTEHDFFHVVPASTTALTTVLVDRQHHTRTCLFTPGTCGEWTVEEMRHIIGTNNNDSDNNKNNIPWHNVLHFHSDARHTDAALYVARQAKAHRVPISLDVEKDRHSPALDELLVLADIIFTNALQLKDYLKRLTLEWEAKAQPKQQQERQPPLPPMDVNVHVCNRTKLSSAEVEAFVGALEPMTYFTRVHQQIGKQIVITKGDQGSIHVQCDDISVLEEMDDNSAEFREKDNIPCSVVIEEGCIENENKNTIFKLRQEFMDYDSTGTKRRRFCASYTLHAIGILPNVPVVDTTGAGDALLGGYLAGLLHPKGLFPRVADCLRLGAWVAGHKIQGPGARTTLPTAAQCAAELGTEDPAIELRKRITAFGNMTSK